MKLHLTSAYRSHSCLDALLDLARLDTSDQHQLTSCPDAADAIVFVENTQFNDLGFSQLLRHALVRKHPDKVFMYNEMDRSWPILPGVYCSLKKGFSKQKTHVAFPYLTTCNSSIENIHSLNVKPHLLYSFVGSMSHPVRKPLPRLARDNAVIADTSEFCTWDPAQTSKYSFQKLYSDTMAQSQFILCPRGIGPASLRLFESMEAARVPVIISDDWVEPPQVDWSFAVRVAESDIEQIPGILANLDNEWQDRSTAARSEWEKNYSPSQMFNTLGNAIESVQDSARITDKSLQFSLHKWQVLAGQFFRNIIRPSATPTGRSITSPRASKCATHINNGLSRKI